MEHTRLGKTGMKVSRLCLGTMSYGSTDWREWVLDEELRQKIMVDTPASFYRF